MTNPSLKSSIEIINGSSQTYSRNSSSKYQRSRYGQKESIFNVGQIAIKSDYNVDEEFQNTEQLDDNLQFNKELDQQ